MNVGFYLFLAYVFMLPLEYYQEKLPKGPTGINYRTLTLLVLTGSWLLYRANRQKLPFLRSPLNPIVAVYLFIVLFCSLLGTFSYPQIVPVWDPGGDTFKWYFGVVNGIVIFWASAALLDTRKKIRFALLALCASAPIVYRAFASDFSAMSKWHYQEDMRATLPFVTAGSNELGAFLVVGAVVMLIWAFAKQRWWERCAFLGGFSFYAYCIMYSFSRGSQLGLGVALALLAFLRHRWILIVMLVAFLTMDFWVPVSVKDRWQNTTDENGKLEVSAASREDFWALAMQLFAVSPLFGHGVGSFKIINPAGLDTHNLYLRTLAEQGLIGGIVLVLMWTQLLKMSVLVWRKAQDPEDRQLGLALFVTTVALMVCNIFGDRFTYLQLIGQYWMVAGIVARLYARQMGWEPLADDGVLAAPVSAGAAKSAQPAGAGLRLPAPGGYVPAVALIPALTTVHGGRGAERTADSAHAGDAIPWVVQPTTAQPALRAGATPQAAEPIVLGAPRPRDDKQSAADRLPELKIAGRAPETTIRLIHPQPESR